MKFYQLKFFNDMKKILEVKKQNLIGGSDMKSKK